VRALFADLDAGVLRPAAEPGGLANLLCARGRAVVGWAGWQRIDEAERALGAGAGRSRTKITERARLVRIGTGPGPDSEEGQNR
jgi:ferredoxin--NADP+ reductase